MSDQLICAWCGEPFERPGRSGPLPRYCRPSHRQRAHETRHHDDTVANTRAAKLAKVILDRLLAEGVVVHRGRELAAGEGATKLKPGEAKALPVKPRRSRKKADLGT